MSDVLKLYLFHLFGFHPMAGEEPFYGLNTRHFIRTDQMDSLS